MSVADQLPDICLQVTILLNCGIHTVFMYTSIFVIKRNNYGSNSSYNL